MAILPVRLCRIFRRSFFFLFPFGKCPLALIAFIILLNHRQQTPCQRLIYKLWNLSGVMSLLKEIGEKAHYVCITPEENCGFRIHIMINYFQELMTDEQYDYLKYETIMENEGMAELLKMPELTQEQLEAALIIKSILDRFDTETKVDRTTAFKAVLDHMGQTKEEGMNLNRMIDLLEKLLQAVLNEEGE